MYSVSKNCANLFLSELRQISTSFDNFWQKDSKLKAKRLKLYEVHSFSTSSNLCHHSVYRVKHRYSKLLGYITLKVVICSKLSNDLISTQ